MAGLTSGQGVEGRTLRVHVTFFAPFRYQLGVSDYAFEFTHAITVAELLSSIRERWPRFVAWNSRISPNGEVQGLSIIVNGQATKPESVLEDGDEVGILGPISGG